MRSRPDCCAVQGRRCPEYLKERWSAIDEMNAHLGLTGKSEIEERIHTVFLPVTLSLAAIRREEATGSMEIPVCVRSSVDASPTMGEPPW